MISIVVNSENCRLLPYQPGDDSPIRLSVSIPVTTERGLTGATSRKPTGLAPRYSIEYRAVMVAAEYAALRAASLTMQDEPVLVPLWPHAYRVGVDTATITAGLVIGYNSDFSSYSAVNGSLAGYTYAVPLIYGRFRHPPRMAAAADGLVVADIVVDEDSPVGYSLNAASGVLPADSTLTNAAGYSAPVFPFLPDWSKMPEPSFGVTSAERLSVGPGRRLASTWYPQTPEQIPSAHFSFVGATEAAQAIAWWVRRCGETDAHWVPNSQKLWRLAANASAAATSITIDLATPAPAVGAIIALCGAAKQEYARVTGVSGATLTLASGLSNSWTTDEARVTAAFLARHTNRSMVLDYSPAGWFVSCDLSWRQLAAEETLPSGETRGTTVGRVPGEAWFFEIGLDYNGATVTTYLTNWESGASGATVGSHTWTYNPCDFDKLIKSIDLEDDSCTFKLRWFAGCPWENWQPGALAAQGTLTIYRADVDSAGAFSNYGATFKGQLSSPIIEGANISVRVLGANALFARRAPKQVMSQLCGTNLFRARCGLALSDWTWNATIAAVSGNLVTIGSISRANGSGNPAGFGAADWFALGWMQWTASGLPQRLGILTSTLLSGGQIVLTLDKASGLSVSASVKAVPGCDRLFSTCGTKFSNSDNFRGFPFMPSVSPNFVIPHQSVSSGKK